MSFQKRNCWLQHTIIMIKTANYQNLSVRLILLILTLYFLNIISSLLNLLTIFRNRVITSCKKKGGFSHKSLFHQKIELIFFSHCWIKRKNRGHSQRLTPDRWFCVNQLSITRLKSISCFPNYFLIWCMLITSSFFIYHLPFTNESFHSMYKKQLRKSAAVAF